MWRQYKVWCMLVMMGFISALISLLTTPNSNNKFDLLNMTIVLFCQLLVFLISRRWNKLFVYLLPFLLIATYAGMIVKISVLQKEGDKDDWSLERH